MVGGRIINGLEEENYWSLLDLKESAALVDVCVRSNSGDIFSQVSEARLIIRAPFCYIGDPRTCDTSDAFRSNPVLNRLIHERFRISDTVHEFEQQHQVHSGQQFAVIRLMVTSKRRLSFLHDKEMFEMSAEILVLESTELKQSLGPVRVNGHVLQWAKKDHIRPWRRIGFLSISIPLFLDDDDINVRCFEEMKKANWEWREVMIV